MRKFIVATGAALALLPQTAGANPDADAVKTFIKAVKSDTDLSTAYPNAVSTREAASLQRVRKCDATNVMKQKTGEYTVVWVCSGGALGMRVALANGTVASVSTFEIERRLNTN